MSKVLEPDLWFGDIVYRLNDPNQDPHIVTDMEFNGGPTNIRYHIQSNGYTTEHYLFEISKKRNELLAMGINKE